MNLDLAVRDGVALWGGVVRGAGFHGSLEDSVFLIFCGQVFKSTRWMPWH